MEYRKGILAGTVLALVLTSPAVEAGLIYSADFSTVGQGFTHSNQSRPAASGSVTGGSSGAQEGRWTASYTTEPATDNTPNSFATSLGNLMSIVDFGGPARLESFEIDVSGVNLVDVSGANLVTGFGANDPGEYFRFFYRLDNGTEVFSDFSAGGNYSVSSLDVSAVQSMTVGFVFDINSKNARIGPTDGWQVSTLTVSASPVPEPETVFLLCAMFGGLAFFSFSRVRRDLPGKQEQS